MQFSLVLFVLGVAAVSAEVIDINQTFDEALGSVNQFLRDHRFTSVHVPKGSFGNEATFSDSNIIGLDSLRRTDNCTLEIVDQKVTVDYHYGFGLFQQTFKILAIGDKEMSGGFRIRDNSVRIHFSVNNVKDKDSCSLELHDLSYERLAGVDFYASRPEFDGINVEEYFEKVLTPYLNNKIDRSKIEKILQSYACKQRDMNISDYMKLIQTSVSELFIIPSQL